MHFSVKLLRQRTPTILLAAIAGLLISISAWAEEEARPQHVAVATGAA